VSLQRLIITFKSKEIVLHALYKTQDGPNPGTKARLREVKLLAGQERPHASPAGLRGRCGGSRDQRLRRSGGCSFAHDLTQDSNASEGSVMETVDADLDRLICKRASKDRRPDPDELDAGYMESVRAYEEKRRQAARLEWHRHHTAQAERLRRTLKGLIAHHEEQAAKLMDVRPKGA
jgi:hypothetical protein